MNARARHLILHSATTAPHFPYSQQQSEVILSPENFHSAKNLLGQEFDWILFDARTTFNLEALAIAAGTLCAGGCLIIWIDPKMPVDLDSLRWSGLPQAIATPQFSQHFFRLIDKYTENTQLIRPFFREEKKISVQPTLSQQQIIDQILQQQSELYIITAKRGRGKSALAGFLMPILQQTKQLYLLTAPNKSAVQTLQYFANAPISFIAPDALAQQIEENRHQFDDYWLFIDEAARLPLPLLLQLISAFKHIVLTTTIHSYEGTGRGFLLKFLANLHRTYQQFELFTPLRWLEGDKVENFIDELLLLECEDQLPQPDFNPQSAVQIRPVSQAEIAQNIKAFYGLLTLAHYRTSPLDLRRLFDAPQQQFWLAKTQQYLLANAWLVQEGEMQDDDLIEQICRGERRPKGNLVAQSLALQYHLPLVCKLKSLRISRIAVQPKWQQQGIGQQLIAQIAQTAEVDFLSVSFGYTPELAQFWQKCGFVLVHIGEHQEASSGCYSAIALLALSSQGKMIAQQSQQEFERNIALTSHPLQHYFTNKEIDWQLRPQDWQSLQNFAYFHRTLAATRPAIQRLLHAKGDQHFPLLSEYIEKRTNQNNKKSWLVQCRLEIQHALVI